MKKYLTVFCAALMAAALMSGCVPKEETTISVNPDFVPDENIEINYTQLHNDALEGLASIEDGEPFIFIREIDISGKDESDKVDNKKMAVKSRTLEINATAVDGTTGEDCENFTSALLCQIGDAACIQDTSLTPSTRESFGSYYDKCSLSVHVTNEESGAELFTMEVMQGDDIPLDPDYEKYVEAWIREYEVYQENIVYNADGSIKEDN